MPFPKSMDSPPLTPPLAVWNNHLSSRTSKQYWRRTTFLALFALIVVSAYILLVTQPSLSPIALNHGDYHQRKQPSSLSTYERLTRLSSQAGRLAALRHKRPNASTTSNADRPQIELNPAQELAAVSAFIASLPQNVIPSSVDPSLPIDPQLVLDFDTRSPQAQEEVSELVHDVWARNPVMLYSKLYSPVSRELKQILTDMNLHPSPTIIEVDQRSDEAVLMPLLYRLTSSSELPILLIGGETVGSLQEIRYLSSKGELARMISNAGATVNGGKKKKGRKH